jgi:hypothetical protein
MKTCVRRRIDDVRVVIDDNIRSKKRGGNPLVESVDAVSHESESQWYDSHFDSGLR